MNRRQSQHYWNDPRHRGGRDESHWSHSTGGQRYMPQGGGRGDWGMGSRESYRDLDDRFDSHDIHQRGGSYGAEPSDWGRRSLWEEDRFGQQQRSAYGGLWRGQNFGSGQPHYYDRNFGSGGRQRYRGGSQDFSQDFGSQGRFDQDFGRNTYDGGFGDDMQDPSRGMGGMENFGDGGRMADSGGYGGYGIPAGGGRSWNPGGAQNWRDWRGGENSAWRPRPGDGMGGMGDASGGSDRPRFGGRTPRGYTRSDERIKDDLCERLYYTEDVDVSNVAVEAKNGTITLEGTVPNRRMKHRIEDIAEQCIGVNDVENRIRVSRGSDVASSAAQMGSGETIGSGGIGTGSERSRRGSTGNSPTPH